jgi:hypothetical protein
MAFLPANSDGVSYLPALESFSPVNILWLACLQELMAVLSVVMTCQR